MKPTWTTEQEAMSQSENNKNENNTHRETSDSHGCGSVVGSEESLPPPLGRITRASLYL